MYISTIYTTHRIIFRYNLTTDSSQLESISLRDIVFHILFRKRRDLQLIILDCFVHLIKFSSSSARTSQGATSQINKPRQNTIKVVDFM